MKMRMLLVALLGVVVLASGCSIKHPIAADYGRYLTNNEGQSSLPRTSLQAEYQIDSATANHHYEFRAASAGAAHVWIVEFGKILKEHLDSRDVQASFGSLTPSVGSMGGNLITFTLNRYEFKDFQAYVTMAAALSQDGREVFRNTYNVTGKSQGGKVFMGGAFAMKNAVQQSTKMAIDDILTQFIGEIKGRGLAR